MDNEMIRSDGGYAEGNLSPNWSLIPLICMLNKVQGHEAHDIFV